MATNKAEALNTASLRGFPQLIPFLQEVVRLSDRHERLELAVEAILARLAMPALDTFKPETKADGSSAAAEAKPEPVELDAAKLPAYEYKALDVSKSEVRILQLKASPDNDDAAPLVGTLVPVSLDIDRMRSIGDVSVAGRARSSFTALSYTWGAPVFDGVVIIDGRALRITKSLERALRQLRRNKSARLLETLPKHAAAATARQRMLEKPTYWWVDALCINQGDIDERNAQVALMRRIYHGAATVVVWLGDEGDDSTLAMSVARELAAVPARGPGGKVPEYPFVSDEEKIRKWRALAALFRRPWWKRAWIRQEVALAKRPEVHVGDASCSFSALVQIGKLLAQLSVYLKQDPAAGGEEDSGAGPGSSSLSANSHQDQAWRDSWYAAAAPLAKLNEDTMSGMLFVDLVDLLFHGRACQATDQRDKVYAVLGLADPEVYGLTPDYRLSATDIYLATARAAITKTKRLQILSACQNPGRQNGLPSWVPDLNAPWRAYPFPVTKLYSSHDDADVSFSDDGRTLRAKGYVYGTVGTLCPTTVNASASTSSDPQPLQHVYVAWKQFLADAFATFKTAGVYGQPHSSLERLCGMYHDRAWLDFLSLDTMRSSDLAYGKDGQPLADALFEPGQNNNLRLAHALLVPAALEAEAHPYARLHGALRQYGVGRCLGVVEEGSVALLPGDVRPGDVLAALDGTKYPYVLRKAGGEDDGDDEYVLVGEAYIYSQTYGSLNKEVLSIV